MSHIERFFARYGGAVVVLARFFFGLRQLNGIVAGIGSMPAPLFVTYNAIGAALWVGLWGVGAYWFGHRFQHLIDTAGPIALYVLGGVCALAIAGFFWWRFAKNNR